MDSVSPQDYPGGTAVRTLPTSAGDVGSIPGSRRPARGGNGNPLQYSCLENPTDSGAWWATVRRVERSQTQLKRVSTHAGTILPLRQPPGPHLHLVPPLTHPAPVSALCAPLPSPSLRPLSRPFRSLDFSPAAFLGFDLV